MALSICIGFDSKEFKMIESSEILQKEIDWWKGILIKQIRNKAQKAMDNMLLLG